MAPPAWAYQPEYFITPPDDELICSICSLVFCDPTECPCQHAFCRNCIQRWLDRQRDCPICRKPVFMPIRPSAPFIRNLIAKMKMKCHNKEAGCEASFALEACEHHLKECDFELVECVCGKSVMRKDVQKHNSADCPFGRDSVLLLNDTSDAEKEKNQIKKELNSLRGKAIGKMAVRVPRPPVLNACTVDPVIPFPSTSTASSVDSMLILPPTPSASFFTPWNEFDGSAVFVESLTKKKDFLMKLGTAFNKHRNTIVEARKAKINKIAEIKKNLLSDSGFSSPSSSMYAKAYSSLKRGSSSKGGESHYGKIQIISSTLPHSFPSAASVAAGIAAKAREIRNVAMPSTTVIVPPSSSGFTTTAGTEKGMKTLNYSSPTASSSSDVSSEKRKKIAAIKNSLQDRHFSSFPSTSSASNYSSASGDSSSEKKKKIAAIKNSLFDNDFSSFPSTSSACAAPKTPETSSGVNQGMLDAEDSIFNDLMKKIQSIRHKCLNVSKASNDEVKVRPETGEGTDVCDIVYDSRLNQDSTKDKVSNSGGSDQKSHDVYEIQMDDDYSPPTFQPSGSPSSSGENFQLPLFPKGGFSDQDSGSSSSHARTEQKAATFFTNWDPLNWKPLLSGPKNTTQFFHQLPLQKASTSTLSAAGVQNGEASNFHEPPVSHDTSQMPNQASALQEPCSWEPSDQDQFIYGCVPWNYWDNYDG